MRRASLTLLLAAAFGLAGQLLFYRESLGSNVLLAVAAFFAVAWRLRSSRPHRLDLWMAGFAFAFAAFLAIRAEPAVVAFDLLAMLVLTLASTASLRGMTVTALPVGRLIAEAWRTGTGTLWRAAPVVRCGIRHLPLAHAPGRQVLPYLGGLLLAVPFLALFAALFTSADPVFARWWEELIDLGQWAERLGEAKDRLIIAVVFAWLAAGALARIDRSHRETGRDGAGLLEVQTATSLLIAIVAMFAAFVAFQVTYLFGGRDTVEAAEISYADYARRGFFELLAVAGLVAAILFGLELALRARTRVYLASGLALIGLTGVVLASSLYRLDLYQRAYGWSELRLYVLAALVTVAAALVLIGWALVTGRMRIALQPMVFVALGVALMVNAIGPAGFIVRANVSRLLEPDSGSFREGMRERQLDRWYLTSLGEAAVPAIVAVSDQLPELERFCLFLPVYWQNAAMDTTVAPSWQSWNLDRERARAAIARIREYLRPMYRLPDGGFDGTRANHRYETECLRLPPRPPPERQLETPGQLPGPSDSSLRAKASGPVRATVA